MKKTLIDFVREAELLHSGDAVLCAVSGGADSTALLHCLVECRAELGITVAAAHYNHGIRENAKRDECFVKELADKLEIPFFAEMGDVPAYACAHSIGLEEAARIMRYDFLGRAAEASGADCIATAHTADDNLETVIMNMIRGSGSGGAAGIPPRRGNIVRPMLTVSREMVEDYLAENSLPHVEDESNELDDYTRNKVRHHVSPVLKEINPKAAINMSRSALRIRADMGVLESAAKELSEAAVCDGESVSIEAGLLQRADRAIASRCVMLLFGKVSSASLAAVHISQVLNAAVKNSENREIALPDGVRFYRQYDKLVFERCVAYGEIERTYLPVGGNVFLQNINAEIECVAAEGGENVYNSVNTFVVERDMIKGNLTVRSRQTGDRIKLRGRPEKSLKKLFIERKIPQRKRLTIPVIADDEKVLAVAGMGADERVYAVSDDAVIIKICYGGNGE